MGGTVEQEIAGYRFIVIFVCGIFAISLMITSTVSTYWFRTSGHRQGLFRECVEDINVQLPSYLQGLTIGCHPIRQISYIQAVAASSIVAILTTAVVIIFTGLGLWCKDLRWKIRYYMLAAKTLALPLLALFSVLLIYPFCFHAELIFFPINENISWEIGWGYGLCGGAQIFLIGCIILFM